ncbi:MAG: hypothetical protein KF777_13230 [Planctomycetaceae bacterium]|nr:hypothetical protein [Planctomycetaceae bacterium]
MSRSTTSGIRTILRIALCLLLFIPIPYFCVLIFQGHTAAGMAGLLTICCLYYFMTCGWAALEKLITWRDRAVVFAAVVYVAAAGLFIGMWLRGIELSGILVPITLLTLCLIQLPTVRLIHERWLKAGSPRTMK